MAFFRWWSQQPNGSQKKTKKKKECSFNVDKNGLSNGQCSAGDQLAGNNLDGSNLSAPRRPPAQAGDDLVDLDQCCFTYPVYAFESIRLLLFRENEYRERRVLFDSYSALGSRRRDQAGGKVATQRYENVQQCDDRLQRESIDQDTVKLLGEMIFGSVSMSVKVDTFKLHQFRSPQRLMLSKIIPCIQPEMSKANNNYNLFGSVRDGAELFESDSDSPSSTINSVDGSVFKSSCKSIPLEIPDKLYRSPRICSPNVSGHSSAPFSYRADNSLLVGNSNASLSSSLKRFNLNQSTNFSFKFNRRQEEGDRPESPMPPSVNRLNRLQLGFCVLFDVDDNRVETAFNNWFKRFLLLHMQIVEIELDRLQRAILQAYFSKKVFTNNVCIAWQLFLGAMRTLYETPRLANPAWLSLVQADDDRQRRAALHVNFLRIFSQLADECDVRETKFFLSTLLTACLMNHLTWVSSVAPPLRVQGEVPKRKRLPQWRKNVEGAAHPYNTHLAQLLDIWGMVTRPCRIAHTLVLGNKRDLVMKILFLLSYFIRCSVVEQKQHVHCDQCTWPSLNTVDVGRSAFEKDHSVETEEEEEVKWLAEGGEIRCNSKLPTFSTGEKATTSQQRARHCSEENQMRVDCALLGRIRCRSGSTLSADRLMRMSAATFKLPSKLSSSGSQLPTSLQLFNYPSSTTLGDQNALGNSQPEQLSSANGEQLCSSASLDHSSALGEEENQQKIAFADVFAHTCIERIVASTGEHESPGDNSADATRVHLQNAKLNLGNSMIAGYGQDISAYFSLAGASATPNAYDNVLDTMKQLALANIQSPEPIREAVCVVANTMDWSVRLISSSASCSNSQGTTCLVPSKLISDMVDEVKCLYRMKLAEELCMTTLEDCLCEVYSKSCALATLVEENRSNTLDMLKLVDVLNCDLSDIPLLISVATVHSSDTIVSLGVT